MVAPITKAAVAYLAESDDVGGAVTMLMESTVSEAMGTYKQTQVWAVQDQDVLNRFCLYLKNQMGLECKTNEYSTKGGYAGYAITVTGSYRDGDIASIAGSVGKGQIHRIDNPPGGTGK